LPPIKLSSDELKAAILHKIVRQGRAGAHYYPVQSIVNQLGKKILKNGKSVKKAIKDLINDGLLLSQKKGNTVSANPHRMPEILKFIEENYKL